MLKFCDSCGGRMNSGDEHGGGREDNPYCRTCCDETGNLLPREEVKKRLIKFYVDNYGYSESGAAQLVEENMSMMPAWSK